MRIGSRAGEPPLDWEDEATWAAAVRGAHAVYVSYYPDLAMPGAVDTVGSFVDRATSLGVRRLVLVAGRGEEEAERAERVVQESGVEWTVVRPSWFNQNFSESYLLEPILAGEVFLPVAEVGEPFVDADDIADVAAAALTDGRHAGRVYELTGPRLLTFEKAVQEIAAATGRPIRYVQISPEAYSAALEAEGVPAEYVWLLNYLFANVLDGRNARVAHGVEQALGRPPRDFADYAREAAATGVWRAGALVGAR